MQPCAVILDAISVPDMSSAQLIALAAANGYDGVSLWVHAPVDTLPIPILRAGTAELRDVRKALDDAGLVANGVEVLDLSSALSGDAIRTVLDATVELGAKAITAVCFAPLTKAQLLDRLVPIAQDAAERGLHVTLEFMSRAIAGAINSLPDALDLAEATGMANVGLTMDMLHLTRTGATIEQIRAVPAERIFYVQLCDGPAEMPPQDQMSEAGWGRMYPGEGEFHLREMLAALPDGKPVGLEIPRACLASADIARDAMAAARGFLQPKVERT
jgi:sugar phosphate isomerase/epimerase